MNSTAEALHHNLNDVEQRQGGEIRDQREKLSPRESFSDAVEKFEAAACARVAQLIETAQAKVIPAIKEALITVGEGFTEEIRRGREDLAMMKAMRRKLEALDEFDLDQAGALLEQVFGYPGDETRGLEEKVEFDRKFARSFFQENRARAVEVRSGRGTYKENQRWEFYGCNSRDERFSIEIYRSSDKFVSLDIARVISEPGEPPEYGQEVIHLLLNPDGTYRRATITSAEEEKLIPQGEAERLLIRYLTDLKFDAESSRVEQLRLARLERERELIDLSRTLGERLAISAVGEEVKTQVEVRLDDGRRASLTGDPQESYLDVLSRLIKEDDEVGRLAGVTIIKF